MSILVKTCFIVSLTSYIYISFSNKENIILFIAINSSINKHNLPLVLHLHSLLYSSFLLRYYVIPEFS